jgi:outer membrane protein OmpA-like peptidoglycan-associated protein
MKFFILMLICLSSTLCAQQLPVYADENFNDNSRLWVLVDNVNSKSRITDGSLIIQNISGQACYISNNIEVDPSKDFYVESKISALAGTKSTYGFYFVDTRKTKNTKWLYFLISPEKYVMVCENSTEKADYAYYYNQKADDPTLSDNNIFAVERKGSVTNFYLNHKLVATLSNINFWGNFIGYVIYEKNMLNVDYLKVQQESKINLGSGKDIFVKENLGPAINTSGEEVMPFISADGNTLYMAVSESLEKTGNDLKTDISFSKRRSDGSWEPRKKIGDNLNTDASDYVINATPDNNTLLLNGEYHMENGALSRLEGVSICYRTNKGWGLPEKLQIKNYYNYNFNTSYALSPDRKVLICSIERELTFGSSDLYVSFLNDDNTWTEPENMGSIINTHGKDITPYIASDGKTLYYSTSGKPGYGSSDIFFSRRLDDTWKNWSEPVNLGPSVNTINWDAYYTVPASGDVAYIVSDDKSIGMSDIYKIRITKESQPEPVVIIYGKVLNKTDNAPLEADITYHDLSNGKELGIAKSNAADGSYKIVLPYSKSYGFLAEREKFLAESNSINLFEPKPYQEIQQDLYLLPFEIGKTVTLNNVFFVRSKEDLLPESFPEMERLLKILQDNPKIKIELSGHTETAGNSISNKELSEKRVQVIKSYLVAKGIPSNRITGKGYGGTRPITNKVTEEARKLNRRVEFTIVE